MIIVYTSCTLAEVKDQSKDEFDTENALKRFERRGCIHRHKPVSSAECILSIIGNIRFNMILNKQ